MTTLSSQRPRLSPLVGTRRRRFAASPTGRVWCLNALLTAFAAMLAHAVAGLPAATDGGRLPWWALAALFAVTELGVVHIHFRRGSHSFALGEVPLVIGLMFASPLAVMLAWPLGGGLAIALTTSLPRVRVAFNIALFAIAGGIAAAAACCAWAW